MSSWTNPDPVGSAPDPLRRPVQHLGALGEPAPFETQVEQLEGVAAQVEMGRDDLPDVHSRRAFAWNAGERTTVGEHGLIAAALDEGSEALGRKVSQVGGGGATEETGDPIEVVVTEGRRRVVVPRDDHVGDPGIAFDFEALVLKRGPDLGHVLHLIDAVLPVDILHDIAVAAHEDDVAAFGAAGRVPQRALLENEAKGREQLVVLGSGALRIGNPDDGEGVGTAIQRQLLLGPGDGAELQEQSRHHRGAQRRHDAPSQVTR